MYLKVLLTNHRMKNNLEIHLKEVYSKKIYLEDHHSIHLLDHSNGQHLIHAYLYHHDINNLLYNLYQN